jgi:hypothetical protein
MGMALFWENKQSSITYNRDQSLDLSVLIRISMLTLEASTRPRAAHKPIMPLKSLGTVWRTVSNIGPSGTHGAPTGEKEVMLGF